MPKFIQDNFCSLATIMLATCFTVSCDYKKGSANLESEDAQAINSIALSADDYVVDSINSVATWIGTKPTGQHNGLIPVEQGTIAIADQEILASSVTFDIKGLSIMDMLEDTAKQNKLYRHLMSEDFFQADSFPKATFNLAQVYPFDSLSLVQESEQIKAAYNWAETGDFVVKEPTHIISGNLTMRGVTRFIAFPAKVNIANRKVELEALFNIDRTEWGLTYHDESSVLDKAKDKFIYNTVNIGLSLKATAKE